MCIPEEFLFKKFIVALIIELNIQLCKFIDAVVHKEINKADSIKADKIIDSVSTANTITHVFLDSIHGKKYSNK